MGVKADAVGPSLPAPVAKGGAPVTGVQTAMRREEQAKVLHDVESAFVVGVKRADGRTTGLGRHF
jgi:hypothetical protein